jgi:hypothetical protein
MGMTLPWLQPYAPHRFLPLMQRNLAFGASFVDTPGAFARFAPFLWSLFQRNRRVNHESFD